MTDPLAGKVAVITGASSGIGLAIAQALAARNVELVLGARTTERLTRAAENLRPPATTVTTDVTVGRDVVALIETAMDLHGRIDILIANAGVYAGGDFVAGDLSAFVNLIDTNVNGVMRTIHAALVHMVAAGAGDIVVTSSVSGHQAIHWEPAYSASKHAVQALVHTIRRQLVGTGVRLGAVAPGVVLNDLWQITDEQAVAAGVAAGTGIRSEDVADAVLYLLSRPRHVNIRDLVILPTNQEI